MELAELVEPPLLPLLDEPDEPDDSLDALLAGAAAEPVSDFPSEEDSVLLDPSLPPPDAGAGFGEE